MPDHFTCENVVSGCAVANWRHSLTKQRRACSSVPNTGARSMLSEHEGKEIRQLNGPCNSRWAFLSYGLLFCLGVVILATFLDYGLTFDEEFGKTYGEYVLRWYASFFKDQNALGYYNLHLYGGFFEAISQLTVRITENFLPIGVYETRHFVNAVFGFLG